MESLILFIDQFGGKEDVIVLLSLISGLIVINSLIKPKALRLISSVLATLLSSAQAFSLYSTQSFIGYQFYIHMNLKGVIGMQSLFVTQMTTLLIFFIIVATLNFYSYRIFRKLNNFIKSDKKMFFIQVLGLLAFCSLIILEGNFIKDTASLKTLFITNNSSNFEEVLLKYNMSSYTSSDKIESSAGKNIIVISMESLERGFLNEKHSSLTPNLNQLKTKWNYLDLKQNCGSSWTSGSLYTYMTGFPAFFGSQGNSAFKGSYHSSISSIPELLRRANYQTVYLNTDTQHSGVDNMLNVFHFDKVIDYRNTSEKGPENEPGLRDMDLFSIAKSEIETLKDLKKPYALFISTTDSHFPDGIYDKRMEANISPKNSGFEFTVASLDYLIGDFVSYLKAKDILKNTVIYIFPDHLKMGDPSLFESTGERELYVITNANNEDIRLDTSNTTYQIDLPKIILNGAAIEHNLKFLTDYITGDKDQFIRDNINEITEINCAGLLRSNTKTYAAPQISKHYKDYKKDTYRYIAHAGGIIDGYTYTNSLEALNMNYSKGFRLFELDIRKTSDNKYVALHNWEEWSYMTGYTGETPVTFQEFMNHKIHKKYSPLSMKEINDWFKEHPDAILVTDKVNEPELFSKVFIDANRLIMELFNEKALKQGLKFNILSAMPTQGLIAKMGWEKAVQLKLKHVAVSRYFIKENKGLLKKLKENGIKVYVYHVNQDEDVLDSGMDEEYVTKYELDYVYGMYADKWNFE